MDTQDTQKSALELINAICAAVNNIRLYPPTSSLILVSVERMQNFLTGLLQEVNAIEYGEVEKRLIVCGEALPDHYQKRIPVAAFLNLMQTFKIRGMSFEKGLTGREISSFIQILGGDPQGVFEAGGMERVCRDQSITHIKINEKIYVERDSDQRIVAGMEIRDEEILKYIMGDQPISEQMIESLRSLAKDPAWVSRVFQSGVKHLVEAAKKEKPEDVSEIFARMMNVLVDVSDADRQEISCYLINAIPEMPDNGVLTVLTQDLDKAFGDGFIRFFIESLDEHRSKRLVERIHALVGRAAKASGPRIVENRQRIALEKNIKKVEMVLQAASAGHENEAGPPSEDPAGRRAEELKSALSSILQSSILSHERVMLDRMSEAVASLLSKERYAAIVVLFDQMGRMLLNRDPEIRRAAARLMSDIDERLKAAGRLEERVDLSRRLIAWIENETDVSSEYEKLTDQLEDLSRTLIERERAGDAEHILAAYHRIYSGGCQKKEGFRVLASKLLQNLATDDILNTLIKRTRSDGTKRTETEEGSVLVMLGALAIDRLLDLLHDSHDRTERHFILQAISSIGAPAVALVAERLGREGPWFYIRNLTLMLGRIGNASHLPALEPLFKHRDPRVQREAVFAVQNIGGDDVAPLLLKYLPVVDDDNKGLIIFTLGRFRYARALPKMIEMLESRSAGRTKRAKNEIMIKLCEAMARIGAPQAAPVLEKISQAKGFLSITGYDSPVRAAAAKALSEIRGGQ